MGKCCTLFFFNNKLLEKKPITLAILICCIAENLDACCDKKIRLEAFEALHAFDCHIQYSSKDRYLKTNLEILIKLVSQKRESFPKDNFDILPSSSTKDNSSNQVQMCRAT